MCGRLPHPQLPAPPDSRSQGRRSPDRRSPDRRRKGDDGCFSAESRTRERAPRDAPSSGGEDLSSSRGLSRGLSRMNLNLSVSNADRAALLAQRAREKEEELKNRIRLEQLSLQEQMDRLAKVCSKVDSMPSNPRVMHLSFIPNIYRPFFKATWKAYSPQEWTKERFNKLVDKLLSDRATYDDKVSVEPKKTFPEFVAAFFVTNFGAGVIAEKRMLDFFVNCKLNRGDPRIDVICSIAHIFEPCYPMDCYSLWHRMCQALRQSHRPVEPQVGFSQMLEEDLGFLPPSALLALVDAVRAVEPRSPGESHEVQLERLLQAATYRWSEVRASHLLAPCHQLFEMVDTNKDNKVNQSEFQVLARLLGFLQDMDQRAIGQLFPDTTSLMTYERFTEIFQTQTAQRNAFPQMMHLAQLVTNMEADVRGALVAQGASAPSAYPAPAPTPPRSSPRLHSPPHAMRAHTLGLDPWPPLPRQPVSLQEAVPRPPPPPAPGSLPASLEAGRANFHWQFSFQPAVKFGYKSQFPSPAHRALPPKATFVPSPKPLP